MECKHEIPAVFRAAATQTEPHETIGPDGKPKFSMVSTGINVKPFELGFDFARDFPLWSVIADSLRAYAERQSKHGQRIGIEFWKR